MATPEVQRLIEIVNDHAEQINKLQAITTALFVVTKLLSERYLNVENVETNVQQAADGLAYTRLSDESIEQAQKYLRILLKHD